MAIYHNGIKIKNLYHNGKKLESLYHNGIKIYQVKYNPGTVLATVGKSIAPSSGMQLGADIIVDEYNKHFASNGTFPFDISKINNGIKINSSRSDNIVVDVAISGSIQSAEYYPNSPSWTNPIKISKSDLIAGKKVEISKGASSDNYIPVYARYKNGALSIIGKLGRTTCYSLITSGYSADVLKTYSFMRIDSITAY